MDYTDLKKRLAIEGDDSRYVHGEGADPDVCREALEAITELEARYLAPGDDLVERLMGEPSWSGLAEAAREAATRISALTATVTEVTQERDRYKMACDSQGKVVVDVAGTMDKISPAQMEAMSAILLNPMICASEARAEAAEAEVSRLRDHLALVEAALQRIADGNPTIDSPEADAANSATIARAALTDGGSNG